MTKILALKASILHHVYTFVCWLPSADHVQSTRYDIKSRAYHMLFGGKFYSNRTHTEMEAVQATLQAKTLEQLERLEQKASRYTSYISSQPV